MKTIVTPDIKGNKVKDIQVRTSHGLVGLHMKTIVNLEDIFHISYVCLLLITNDNS